MSGHPEATSPARATKVTIGLIVAALILALSLSILAARGSGLTQSEGFLGTRATLLSDLSLGAALMLLAGLFVGFVAARARNIPAHQYIQTSMVLLYLVLIVFIMEVSFWENVSPGIPGRIGEAAYAVPALHAALGGLAALCGLYLVLLMNGLMPKALRIRGWKRLMRITLALFALAGVLGIATYYVWYVAPA
jgi:uncharacterized membrane protein YozB (DUF420 family)